MGLPLPVEHGGIGGDAVDQLVLSSEMGRALLPSPHLTSSIVCGRLLELSGSPSQKSDMLPLLAQGRLIMSLALEEEWW